MTNKINLKSIECECGQLCTSPQTHNEISKEFENFQILKHEKRPEVIDNDTLRKMNDLEQKEHLSRVENIVNSKHKEIVKRYPLNKFTISKEVTETHIIHTVKCELVEAIVNHKDNKTALSCPKCNKILYEVSK